MNTQHTFILKIIENMSLLCLLTRRYDLHSLAQTSPVSNIFPKVFDPLKFYCRLHFYAKLNEIQIFKFHFALEVSFSIFISHRNFFNIYTDKRWNLSVICLYDD